MKKLFTFLFGIVFAGSTLAQEPLRIVIPWTPGGSVDRISRALSIPFQEALGQSVTLDYRPGAGGLVGYNSFVQNTTGPALFISNSGNFAINDKQDPVNEVVPVLYLGFIPEIIVARPNFRYDSFEQLMSDRTNPAVNWASLQFSDALTRIRPRSSNPNLNLVPYKGTAAAVTDILGGHIDMATVSVAGVVEMIRAQKLKPLAVIGNQRSLLLPDVPTYTGLGTANEQAFRLWIVASKNTSSRDLETITRALRTAYNSTAFNSARRDFDLVEERHRGTTVEWFAETINQARRLSGAK